MTELQFDQDISRGQHASFGMSAETEPLRGHVQLRLIDHHFVRAPETIQKWASAGGWKQKYAGRFLTHYNQDGEPTRCWWVNLHGYDEVAEELGWKPIPAEEKARILARLERTRKSNTGAAKN